MLKENNFSKFSRSVAKFFGLEPIIEISSDYVSDGSPRYFGKIAPVKFWIHSLWWPVLVSLLLAAIPYPCGCTPITLEIEAKAYDVAFSLIPSLLGFGIGAYALVFGLSGDLLKKIQDEHNKKDNTHEQPASSVLSINSSFAFPLIIMIVTCIVASVQKILPSLQILESITWFLVFLSLVLVYQLVVSLYKLGRVIILDNF